MTSRTVRSAIVTTVLACCGSVAAQGGAGAGASPSGGRYADLAPSQQRLFADVLQRYNAIARTTYPPVTAYGRLAPSSRTTFEAVTNALATTALADQTGASLGTGLDLIAGIEEILGESRGTRGDRQFRLHVLLAPDANDRLTRSREFVRTADNTIYHPGYPVSFRLRGGTPSIQVSMSRDGRRGDIDVDYRSSRFPAALVNGHLTSANSDVRAGRNYSRHQRRWQGLGNWWEQLLTLFAAPQTAGPTATDAGAIPVRPRTPSDAPIEAVVADFLTSWLVERRPSLAAAYFSPRSFGCIRERGDVPVGQGLERYVVLERMKAANQSIGATRDLRRVSVSVNPWDRRLNVMRHSLAPAVLLARVRPDLAAAYDCANRDESDAAPSLTDGEYFASAFRLRVPGGPAPAIVLVWAKEADGVRIVAVDVEEATEPSVPIRGSRPTAPSALPRARRVAGPPAMIDAVTAFHRAWFLDRDTERTLSYFDELSYGCLPSVSDGAMRADRPSLQTMLEHVSTGAPSRTALAVAIRTVEPTEPHVNVVDHAEQTAFTLVPVSDDVARAAECGRELAPMGISVPRPGTSQSGQAFVSYFQLNLPGDPAFVWMLWRYRADRWRVHYWTVETP